ncbi:MAG: hypothetical protein ACREQ9_19400, partial [Candidatus Binatia bacterium]
ANAPPATYAVEYQVVILEDAPTVARIRWKLAGIDEIVSLRMDLRGGRFYDFSGTGELEEHGDELVWRPRGPYARLEYKVKLRQRRSGESGFDSYADDDWVITRAKTLFPRVRVTIKTRIERHPVARASLSFRLPNGWEALTAMKEISPRVFRPERSGRFIDRPNGWFALGRLHVERRTIDGTTVTIAKAPGSRLDSEGYLDLYEKTLPAMTKLLKSSPERLLIVSGAKPMWSGGISGRNSFYIHGDRPVRTPDRTSPALHELFHVLAPFRPAEDAEWVTEGLAEYYSLAVQHRVGAIKERDLQRGLRLFERYGEWNVNLTARRNLAATNNSAPLVVYAIDRAIRDKTRGERSLDDVVARLVPHPEAVSTASFLRAVNAASGHNFTSFFRRHVYAGTPPKLQGVAAETPREGNGGGRKTAESSG